MIISKQNTEGSWKTKSYVKSFSIFSHTSHSNFYFYLGPTLYMQILFKLTNYWKSIIKYNSFKLYVHNCYHVERKLRNF